jgi:hypothetical protein
MKLDNVKYHLSWQFSVGAYALKNAGIAYPQWL